MVPGGEITTLLRSWREGDRAALDALLPLVYADLRRIAAGHMRDAGAGHTMSPTDLVHESFLKLARGAVPECQDRKHFFAVAAKAMRQLLVDHRRRRHAQKRHREAPDILSAPVAAWDVLDLDAALRDLEAHDARKAETVELRFFAGLQLEEIGELHGVSAPTVSRELRLAEAWLAKRIRRGRAATRADR